MLLWIDVTFVYVYGKKCYKKQFYRLLDLRRSCMEIPIAVCMDVTNNNKKGVFVRVKSIQTCDTQCFFHETQN